MYERERPARGIWNNKDREKQGKERTRARGNHGRKEEQVISRVSVFREGRARRLGRGFDLITGVVGRD